MTDKLIADILAAKKLEDVLDINNLRDEYRSIMKQIHPDVCKHPDAASAASKMGELKEHFENGKKYTDEAGTYTTNGYTITYTGDKNLLAISMSNYQKLLSFKDPASANFHQYLPESMTLKGGTELEVKLRMRSVPLSGHTLPQKHVNWITSRMLEFTAWLNQVGFVHCGINPESVFVIPQNHGIQVPSFYLMAPVGSSLKGVSGPYRSWYPARTFTDKDADPTIDLELVKRTSIYLLGDRSGMGVKLRKSADINQEVLQYLITQDATPYDSWKRYRDILSKNFKKEFHELSI